MMQMFTSRRPEPAPPQIDPPRSAMAPHSFNRESVPAEPMGLLSRGVSIKGTVKFQKELVIDGEVEGEIRSNGRLTIGEHAHIYGEIKSKSIKVQGTVEGNIVATERCALEAGCTLRGDIEAPRLIVDENATFLGSAKVGAQNDSR